MLDIKFLRENPDIVKQNIKNKFQDQNIISVDISFINLAYFGRFGALMYHIWYE